MKANAFLEELAEAWTSTVSGGEAVVEVLNAGWSFDCRGTRARFDLDGHSCMIELSVDDVVFDAIAYVVTRLRGELRAGYTTCAPNQRPLTVDLKLTLRAGPLWK